jgi:hypothetical protein
MHLIRSSYLFVLCGTCDRSARYRLSIEAKTTYEEARFFESTMTPRSILQVFTGLYVMLLGL